VIVLGIDPGPTSDGVAWLALERGRWAVADIAAPATPEHIGRADLVAIEEPEQVHPRRMSVGAAVATGSSLLATARRVADLRLLADRAGVPCVTITCREARRAMGVRGRTPDRATGIVLARLVAGWPARSNAHVRDAAIVAMAGHARWTRRSALV
jgi:hypothetical protein